MEVDGTRGDLNDHESDTDAQYYAKLRGLNQCFLKWIQEYMQKSPHYLFTPVCKDYIAYAEKLEKDYPRREEKESKMQLDTVSATSLSKPAGGSNHVTSKSNAITTTTISPVRKEATIGERSNPGTSTPVNSKPLFTFGVRPAQSDFNPPKVSFGANSTAIGSPSNAVKSEKSSPTNLSETQTQNQNQVQNDDDEEYQPPKAESSCVEEADALYTVKCKLFYNKENKFVERGVGMLYIKKQDESKYQLLIRADTTLGNIILNILLTSNLPISKKKNGVLLGCVPNPPINPKQESEAVTFFIKVKNEAAADQLLQQLKSVAK